MLRTLVIGRIGSVGHEPVVSEAKKRFAAHCDGSAELPADLRSAVSFLNLILFHSFIYLLSIIVDSYVYCRI